MERAPFHAGNCIYKRSTVSLPLCYLTALQTVVFMQLIFHYWGVCLNKWYPFNCRERDLYRKTLPPSTSVWGQAPSTSDWGQGCAQSDSWFVILSRSEAQAKNLLAWCVFHHLLTKHFDVTETLPLSPSYQARNSDLVIKDRAYNQRGRWLFDRASLFAYNGLVKDMR